MIAYLVGRPIIQEQQLILLVNDVGYGVSVSSKVFHQLSDQTDTKIALYIHTHVREEELKLFGFLTAQEKQLFELVLSVSGVGPSTALHLMDRDPDQLVTAVQEADVSFFSAVPRVGKKLAQKIIIELRGKLGELKELNLAPLSPKQQVVLDALISLGFTETEARNALETIDLTTLNESQAIKSAITYLGNRS